MRVVKSDITYKGTRILLGNEKRVIINKMVDYLVDRGYNEIFIPIIQLQDTFSGKVGIENNNMMFNFTDRGNRNVCLSPEYTSVIQHLAKTEFKNQKDVKVFYVAECFRGEKPQFGRYRQFTQFGVEIINPSKNYLDELVTDATNLIKKFDIEDFVVNREVSRGLDYYENGKGFEIVYENLGSSKQICGGGAYEGGIGFAIGFDRLLQTI